ncbi:hypothetical protein D3C76_1129450 [compost metagenome]
MLEALEAYTSQRLQTLGQRHLILDEEGPGLQVLTVPGRWDRSQRRSRLAEYRVVDVDRVGRAGTSDDGAVVIVLVLDACQQGVAERTGIEMPGQVQLPVTVGPFQLAVVEVPLQGAAVCQ